MQIRKELVSLALLLGSWSFLSISLMAQESINLRQSCSSLRNIALPDTVISISEVVEANNFSPSNSSSSLDTPSFCRVVGVIEPAINFEVWLPLSDWNGKYNGVGNGGMAGVISYGAMAAALDRGYATASTDTGHDQSGGLFDASWASGRPDLIEDFGHRGLHTTTTNAKAITEAFYNTPLSYSY